MPIIITCPYFYIFGIFKELRILKLHSHTHAHTYIPTCTYTHLYMYTHMHILIYTRTLHIHTHIHKHSYAYMHILIYTYTHIHVHMDILIHTRTYLYPHTHAHTPCTLFYSLTHCYISVRTHHDQDYSYESKHLVGACLWFQRCSPMSSCPGTWEHAGSNWSSS